MIYESKEIVKGSWCTRVARTQHIIEFTKQDTRGTRAPAKERNDKRGSIFNF